MKFGLSNFPSVATNDVIEQEVLDLGDAEQLTAPLTESDQELASLCWSDGTDAINASETDCLAGHIGLELPNPRMNYLFEVPCQFPLFWVSALENIRV